jgi:succinate-acetate transporter protein
MSEGKTNWAMATPAALYMIGASCFGLFALLSGLVGVGLDAVPALSVMTTWLIAAAVGIFICGIIDLGRGDILLGTIFVVFAALIFLGGGMSFNAALALAPTGIPAVAAGLALSAWIWLAIGIILLLFLFSVAKVSWSLFLFVLVLAVAVILLAIGLMTGQLPGQGMHVIAGYLIGLFGLYTLYVGTAFVFNTVSGAPKWGIGKPLSK